MGRLRIGITVRNTHTLINTLGLCLGAEHGIRVLVDLEQWTDANDVDELRNGIALAVVVRDENRVKPSTLTLATWWLNVARTAMYQDTGIISAYDYRSRISAWRQYPQLAPEFNNIVEVDWYKLYNHQILHEVCIMFGDFSLSFC